MTYFLIIDTRALAFAAATSSILHVAGNTTMNFELQTFSGVLADIATDG